MGARDIQHPVVLHRHGACRRRYGADLPRPDVVALVMYVVFYTERRGTGEPCQQWAEGVYLYDHWEVCETETEARQRYTDLLERDTTHSAGIGPITTGTDHWC